MTMSPIKYKYVNKCGLVQFPCANQQIEFHDLKKKQTKPMNFGFSMVFGFSTGFRFYARFGLVLNTPTSLGHQDEWDTAAIGRGFSKVSGGYKN